MRVVIDQASQVAVPPLYRGLAKAAAGKNQTLASTRRTCKTLLFALLVQRTVPC